MKVKEYIKILQQFPQDLEIMKQLGYHYYTTESPTLKRIALHHTKANRKVWEDKKSVEMCDETILEEKEVVSI